MTLNATIIKTPDRPTSHVELGKTKLGGLLEKGDLVEISYEDGSVAFRADPVDDTISSTIARKVRVNERLADALFPPVADSEFVVSRISAGDVPTADRVEINPHGSDPEDLANLLTSREAVLHPIRETYDLSTTAGETKTVEFTVTDVEPSRASVRVTDRTEFAFTDASSDSLVESEPDDIAGRSAGADRPGEDESGGSGGGGSGGEEADASISLTPTEPQTSFEEDVAGLSEVKRTARMMLSLFDPAVSEKIVTRYGEEFADRGGGMLLYGPPGCGKTLVSEAIAHEAKANTNIESEYGEVVFLEVRGSDVVSKYAGESEKNVEAAFEQAHELASDGFAVLFFDEVETLIPDRSDDNLQRHERALTNAFLQQMNDVEDNLLVIGATNMPFSIDPAATRRFPIQQFIPQPGPEVMSEVWDKSLGKIAERNDVDCDELGAASVGYTPAEIADRVLGADLQRELVESVADPGQDPIDPNTQYLLDRLEATEPKTVRQYVSSVMKQAQELEGFPEMKSYVESQAQQLGMLPGSGAGDGRGSESDAAGGEEGDEPDAAGDGEGDEPDAADDGRGSELDVADDGRESEPDVAGDGRGSDGTAADSSADGTNTAAGGTGSRPADSRDTDGESPPADAETGDAETPRGERPRTDSEG